MKSKVINLIAVLGLVVSGCATKPKNLTSPPLPVGVKQITSISRAAVVVVPPEPRQVTLVWDSGLGQYPWYNFVSISHDMTNWSMLTNHFPCNGLKSNTYTLTVTSPVYFRMGVTNE